MNKGMIALIVAAFVFIGVGVGGIFYYGDPENFYGATEFNRVDLNNDAQAQWNGDNPNYREGYYRMGRGHMFYGDEDGISYGMMPFGRSGDIYRDGFKGNFYNDDFEHCYEEFNKQ